MLRCGPASANTGTDSASMRRPDKISTVTSNRRPICSGGAAPPSSIRKTSHPHVEDEAEPRQGSNHGGAAVTHERKRKPFDRRQAGRHGDVVHDLEGETGEHAQDEK